MIENERQYQVAKEQAARLEAGFGRLLGGRPEKEIADPLLKEAAHAGVQSILTTLRREVSDYESRAVDADHGADPPVTRRRNR